MEWYYERTGLRNSVPVGRICHNGTIIGFVCCKFRKYPLRLSRACLAIQSVGDDDLKRTRCCLGKVNTNLRIPQFSCEYVRGSNYGRCLDTGGTTAGGGILFPTWKIVSIFRKEGAASADDPTRTDANTCSSRAMTRWSHSQASSLSPKTTQPRRSQDPHGTSRT